MKSRLIIISFFLSCPVFSQAQYNSAKIDSLKNIWAVSSNQQDRVLALTALCNEYSTVSFDSANKYGQQALDLAQQTHFISGEIKSLCYLGIANTRHGEMAKALQLQFRGLQIARDHKMGNDEALCLFGIGHSYFFLRDNLKAINYCKKARQLLLNNKEERYSFYPYFNTHLKESESVYTEIELVIGEAYLYNNQLDSAVAWLQKLYDPLKDPFWINITKNYLGGAWFKSGKQQLGLQYLRDAANFNARIQDTYDLSWSYSILSDCFKQINQVDSSIHYAKLGFLAAQEVGFKKQMLETSRLLATEYELTNNINESHKYLKLAMAINNELFGPQKVFALQKTLAEQQQQQVEAQKQQTAYKNSVRQTALVAGIGIILIIALILYRNNRQKQNANKVLATTLNNLKATQSQLIHSEKMASLGELTAGIAHEIQNPLNFVNNFSEVNKEMVDEVSQEIDSKNYQEAKILLHDIKENSEKINHHGKRADGIVKSMLEHSRTSTGVKEPTDINKLADEYLRLAYQGLCAKDKDFNAEIKTEFDNSIGKINIIPQDIGRVLLNLYNNAFYACAERSRSAVNQQKSKNLISYQPMVWVSTKKEENRVTITVKDNGGGIPGKIKEKIFQPFFTTKPTGSGTGLGLSLSFDIIKAHGGEIKVNTKENEGTAFIIILSKNNSTV